MGLIKKILSGLFAFLGGLFGFLGGGQSGYYLELDEVKGKASSEQVAVAPVATEPAPVSVAPAQPTAPVEAPQAEEIQAPKAEETKAPQAKAPQAKTLKAKTLKAKKTKAKAPQAKKTKAPVDAPKPAPEPALPEGTMPVAAAMANGNKEAGSEKTFATDYLVNPKLVTSGRRRPGPSLSPFKEMARQYRTPVG